MQSLRDLRLKWRITLAVFLASTLVACAVLALGVWSASSYTKKTAQEIAVRTAQENAATIGAILHKALIGAHNLASTLLGVKSAGVPNREELEEILKSLITNSPDMLGVWTIWEPDALDGRDAAYANTPGYDATGRFVPYWNSISGQVLREVIIDYDTPETAPYYFIPKETRHSAIIDPYYYPVRGQNVLMASMSVPLILDGVFVGAAGYDVLIDNLQGLVAGIRPYGAGYASLIDYSNRYIAHPDSTKLLKSVDDLGDEARVRAALRQGELYWTVEPSERLGGEAIKVYAPIRVGDTTTPWALEVVAPISAVMAPVYSLAWNAVLLALITILGSTVVAYMVGRSIAKPITRTAEGITAIASGDLKIEVCELDNKTEIGALARATEVLRQAVADSIRLAHIVKVLPGAIYETHLAHLNEPGDVKYISPGLTARTGFSLEVLKNNFLIVKPRMEQLMQRKAAMKDALAGDGRFEAIWDFTRADGSRGCFFEQGTIIPCATGGYDVTGLLIDYTDTREAEESLDASRKQLQDVVTALDKASESIAIGYMNGEISYANKRFADLYADGDMEAVIHTRLAELVIEADPPISAIADEMISTIKSDRTYASESIAVLKKDASKRNIEWSISPLRDGRILHISRDVTEVRNQEQREEQLKAQLVEAQRMESIGRLAGGIAHDFNNILGAVRTFATLIADDAPADSSSQRFANRIISTCDRAADIVRQILVFARASRSELTPIRMSEVVEEVKSYLLGNIPPNIQLRVELPNEKLVVQGNAGQLVQMIMNLGINARDAIGQSNGKIQILSRECVLSDIDVLRLSYGFAEARTNRADGVPINQFVTGAPLPGTRYLCLTVRDNGPGIPEPTLKRMFEPFFTTKEKARGTGLGLSVVAAVVTAHSGFALVRTQKSHGCRFSIYLPLSSQSAAEHQPLMKSATDLRGHERVLLVDDEVDLADALTLALQKLGYAAESRYNPIQALDLFKADPAAWDVVITDQVMPEMKGLELIEHIKKIRPNLPIIMCTGYSDNTTERTAIATGASAFFIKPVQTETLAQAIRKARAEVAAMTAQA